MTDLKLSSESIGFKTPARGHNFLGNFGNNEVSRIALEARALSVTREIWACYSRLAVVICGTLRSDCKTHPR